VTAFASLALSGLAAALALVALGVALFRDPLGSGMKNYNFTTPRAALESSVKIEMNKDLRAMMEFESKVRGSQQKEKLDTLEVRKEAEFRGKKILFITFKADGVSKYRTEGFEKDAKTGLWMSVHVGSYEVEKDDKELGEQMERWTKSGELSKPK
jgi:hypothetical protein